MADLPLLKSQTNEVFRILQEEGLIPSEFSWHESLFRQDLSIFGEAALEHRPSGYLFAFGDGPMSRRICTFSPGAESRVVALSTNGWADVAKHIRTWSRSLKSELYDPDLWASVSQEKQLIEAAAGEANTPFIAAEREQIALSLGEIREYMKTALDLNSEQLRIASARLDYLERAVDRVGRKDWIMLASGTLMNIVVTAALPPESAREIFRFAGQALAWLIENRHLLPGS